MAHGHSGNWQMEAQRPAFSRQPGAGHFFRQHRGLLHLSSDPIRAWRLLTAQQASAGAEYLLAKNLTMRADYLFVHGVKLPRTLNVNLLPPVLLTLENSSSLGVPNPTAQQIG